MIIHRVTPLSEFCRSRSWQRWMRFETANMTVTPVITLIDEWLNRQLHADASLWLRETLARITAESGSTRTLFIAFGLVGRRCGRADLVLTDSDLAAATAARPSWHPAGWSIDQLARTRIVLALSPSDAERWLKTLDQLFAAAGVEELIALYQALPLLPHQQRLAPRIAEGIRSNMTAVFNAVALNNPIASEQLTDDAWNQMMLKALFVNSPVARMVGAERRANQVLAQMLIDYARERYAAKRPIPLDLWMAARPGCNPQQRLALDQLQASAAAAAP
jgi:hypothetical protein